MTVTPEFKPTLGEDMLDINHFSAKMTQEELKESHVPRHMIKRVSQNQKKFTGEFDMDELIAFGAISDTNTKSEILSHRPYEEIGTPESHIERRLTTKAPAFNKIES